MRQHKTIIAHTGLLILSLLIFAFRAHADPLLNGLAIHNELGQEQFIAGLFSSTLSKDAKTILLDKGEKRIQVRVVNRRISSRSFKRMWIEGIAINASSKELAEQSQNMATFSNMLKVKLVQGDIFTIDRSLDDVIVSLNGTKLGVINDPEFFDILLRTWIGPVPLSSDFRAALLTNGNLDPDTSARFNAIRPSEERIVALENFAKAKAEQQTEEKPNQTTPAAPVKVEVDKPKVAVALPPGPDVASVAAPKIAPPPAIEPVETKAAPKPDKPKKVVPTPTKPPKKVVALAAPQEELLDESILEEEEDDIEFTAAGVLAQTLYISNLKRWTFKHINYPGRALERGWEGNVRLYITIARDGEVQDVVVTEPAPYKDLTKAAVKAVKKADPYPAMPEELPGDVFQFTLPIVFVLK